MFMYFKSIKNIIIITIITISLFLILLEGLTLIIIAGGVASDIRNFVSPLTFEKRYLFSERSYDINNYESKDPALKFYEHHKTRGWTTKKNLKIYVEGRPYTTNNIGERSLVDYKKDESKYEILVLGDSMTFGEESSDEFVWTNILKKINKNLNVINLAVPGYGIDQMYIVLMETIKIYQPDLVILAFVKDDLTRSMISFREARKPYFEIENDELVLQNTPIKIPDEVYKEIKEKMLSRPFYKKLKIYDLFTVLFNSSTYKIGDENRFHIANVCNQYCLQLNEKIFLGASELAKSNNSDFIILYIPGDKIERSNKEYKSYAETLMESMKKKYKINYLNLRPYFLDEHGFVSGGHYQEKGLSLIANIVNQEIILKRKK